MNLKRIANISPFETLSWIFFRPDLHQTLEKSSENLRIFVKHNSKKRSHGKSLIYKAITLLRIVLDIKTSVERHLRIRTFLEKGELRVNIP